MECYPTAQSPYQNENSVNTTKKLLKNSLDQNYIFQTTRLNHTMIFFKLIDKYKLSDIYISHDNCLGQVLIT